MVHMVHLTPTTSKPLKTFSISCYIYATIKVFPGLSNLILFRSNPGTGHYTQVVWADTEELGCGMVYYQGDSFYETLIVCNYAKGGNFLGKHSLKATIG